MTLFAEFNCGQCGAKCPAMASSCAACGSSDNLVVRAPPEAMAAELRRLGWIVFEPCDGIPIGAIGVLTHRDTDSGPATAREKAIRVKGGWVFTRDGTRISMEDAFLISDGWEWEGMRT